MRSSSSTLPNLFALLPSLASAYIQVPLAISNRCSETIYPGLATQNGTPPVFANASSTTSEDPQGFQLAAGATRNLTILTDWNGRVWGRTNCTFDNARKGRCATGDCGGGISCTGTNQPATLAEFNLPAYQSQSFYDISLVDGYNLPIAIQVIYPQSSGARIQSHLPANRTNPSCVASPDDLAKIGWNPYTNGDEDQFLGTTPQQPLQFDQTQSIDGVASWCPEALVLDTGLNSTDPAFRPCRSACKKYGMDYMCCTGKFLKDAKCPGDFYSRAAKAVCPDAYSYAYDDASSTFAVPTGSGFEVVFCPGGRSTIIQKTIGNAAASNRGSVRNTLYMAAIVAFGISGFM